MAKYKKVLSIEIGVSTTKMSEMDYNKKNPRIYNCAIFDTPEGTIEDGYIRNKKAFADVLKERMSEEKMKCKDVVFTLVSSKVISREVLIPEVKDKLISGVVNAEINEYFPMDISDHVISYKVINKIEAEKKLRLIVYAAPENMVNNYYNLAEELGLSIVSLDYVGNSVCQWLKRCYIDPVSFVLQMNEQTCLITAMKNGEMVFQRVIGYGIYSIAEAVVANNVYEAKTPKEAVQLMQTAKLLKYRFDEDIMKNIDEETASPELIKQLNAKNDVTNASRALINSISRVMEYYSSKNKADTPSKIYFTGPGTSIAGLKDLLMNELAVKMEEFNPLERIAFKKDAVQYRERGYDLISCFGAAIAPINFISRTVILKEQKRSSRGVIIIMVLLAIASAVALTLIPYFTYDEELKKQEELQETIKRLSNIKTKYDEYISILDVDTRVTDFHISTFSYSEIFNELIAELEEKIPSGSILHSITFNEQNFNMSLSVKSKEMAAKFLIQLQLIPYISDVSISGLTEVVDNDENRSEVNFSVTCTYKLPGSELEEDEGIEFNYENVLDEESILTDELVTSDEESGLDEESGSNDEEPELDNDENGFDNESGLESETRSEEADE